MRLPVSQLLLFGLVAISLACGKQDSATVALAPAQADSNPPSGVYYARNLQCAGQDLFKQANGYRSLRLIIDGNSAQWNTSRDPDAKTVCRHQVSFSLSNLSKTGFQAHAKSSGENCRNAVKPEDMQTMSDDAGNTYAIQWQSELMNLTFKNVLELDTTLCPANSTVEAVLAPYIGNSHAH